MPSFRARNTSGTVSSPESGRREVSLVSFDDEVMRTNRPLSGGINGDAETRIFLYKKQLRLLRLRPEDMTHDMPGTVGLVAERVEEGAVVDPPDRSFVEHGALNLIGQDLTAHEVADQQGVEVCAVVIFLPRIKASIG